MLSTCAGQESFHVHQAAVNATATTSSSGAVAKHASQSPAAASAAHAASSVSTSAAGAAAIELASVAADTVHSVSEAAQAHQQHPQSSSGNAVTSVPAAEHDLQQSAALDTQPQQSEQVPDAAQAESEGLQDHQQQPEITSDDTGTSVVAAEHTLQQSAASDGQPYQLERASDAARSASEGTQRQSQWPQTMLQGAVVDAVTAAEHDLRQSAADDGNLRQPQQSTGTADLTAASDGISSANSDVPSATLEGSSDLTKAKDQRKSLLARITGTHAASPGMLGRTASDPSLLSRPRSGIQPAKRRSLLSRLQKQQAEPSTVLNRAVSDTSLLVGQQEDDEEGQSKGKTLPGLLRRGRRETAPFAGDAALLDAASTSQVDSEKTLVACLTH